MNETKRQKQVSKLIQEELSHIFQKEGLSVIKGALLTISYVRITPDLMLCNVYFSLSSPDHKDEIFAGLNGSVSEIRYKLGNNLRHSLRRIPELKFFYDDLYDEADKVNKIFNELEIPDEDFSGEEE